MTCKEDKECQITGGSKEFCFSDGGEGHAEVGRDYGRFIDRNIFDYLEHDQTKMTTKIIQFMSQELKLWASITILFIAFLITFKNYIALSQLGSISFLSTIFSTLLGLTFTAFAIISAFMPNIERDFLATKTFESFVLTFKITMSLQLLALVLSIIDYILFSRVYAIITNSVLLYFTFLTLGFMAFLINRTFRVFKITRNNFLRGKT